MNFKRFLMIFTMTITIITTMSTTCEKNDPEIPECNGIGSAEATGFISGTYCFDLETHYDFRPNESVTMFVVQSNTDYIFDCSLYPSEGADLIAGTYSCGQGNPGFVELIYEPADANEQDFYKSQSGTLTITQVDADHFKGSFDVVAKGYYNNEVINFKGTFSK